MYDISLEYDMTWIVMVRPFSKVNGQIFINSYNKFLTPSFCKPCSSTDCPTYDYLFGGDGWVALDDDRNYTNSLEQANEIVKELLINHTFKLKEIKIIGKYSINGMVTPVFQ